jgi:hypothetical protein
MIDLAATSTTTSPEYRAAPKSSQLLRCHSLIHDEASQVLYDETVFCSRREQLQLSLEAQPQHRTLPLHKIQRLFIPHFAHRQGLPGFEIRLLLSLPLLKRIQVQSLSNCLYTSDLAQPLVLLEENAPCELRREKCETHLLQRVLMVLNSNVKVYLVRSTLCEGPESLCQGCIFVRRHYVLFQYSTLDTPYDSA